MIGTGIIVEKAIKLLAKQFKLDKVLKYVEEPNELDNKVDNLDDRVKLLERTAHEPRDFVICEACKKKVKEK